MRLFTVAYHYYYCVTCILRIYIHWRSALLWHFDVNRFQHWESRALPAASNHFTWYLLHKWESCGRGALCWIALRRRWHFRVVTCRGSPLPAVTSRVGGSESERACSGDVNNSTTSVSGSVFEREDARRLARLITVDSHLLQLHIQVFIASGILVYGSVK